MTNEPLDKKIFGTQDWSEIPDGFIKTEDVKSSLSNLKKRLKEEIRNLDVNEGLISEEEREFIFDIIDNEFLKEIGKGLLEDNDGKEV